MEVWLVSISKWPRWSPNLAHDISSSLECIVGGDILSHWENPYTCSLTYGEKAGMVRMFTWKSLEWFLPSQIAN